MTLSSYPQLITSLSASKSSSSYSPDPLSASAGLKSDNLASGSDLLPFFPISPHIVRQPLNCVSTLEQFKPLKKSKKKLFGYTQRSEKSFNLASQYHFAHPEFPLDFARQSVNSASPRPSQHPPPSNHTSPHPSQHPVPPSHQLTSPRPSQQPFSPSSHLPLTSPRPSQHPVPPTNQLISPHSTITSESATSTHSRSSSLSNLSHSEPVMTNMSTLDHPSKDLALSQVSSSSHSPTLPAPPPIKSSQHYASTKRRKVSIRACDACSVRKTRCEEQRPCRHCINNGLECTLLRERKKSGPKNLRKKTLDHINSMRDSVDPTNDPGIGPTGTGSISPPNEALLVPSHSEIRPSLSHHSSTNTIPMSVNGSTEHIATRPALSTSTSQSSRNHSFNADTAPSAPHQHPNQPPQHLHQPQQLLHQLPQQPIQSSMTTSNPSSQHQVVNHGTLVTPTVLVEILVLANHPSLSRVLKPLTVPSLLNNIPKLLEFIQTNFQNKINDINELTSNDPIFLSKLLAILTLSLLVIENIIKFNYFDYQNFQIFNNDIFKLKNFVFFLQNRIIDCFTLINRVLVFPNSNIDGVGVNNDFEFNHFQVNYNQAVASLHMFHYYQITSSLNNNQRYKDQQKLVHLRKAISYFQLIDMPVKNDLNLIQLYEIYNLLFIMERLNHLLDNNLFIKNNNLILNSWNNDIVSISANSSEDNQFDLVQRLFTLLKDSMQDEDVYSNNSVIRLSKFLSINIKHLISGENPSNKFAKFKQLLSGEKSADGHSTEESVLIIIKNIILFKSLIVHSEHFNESSFKIELRELIRDLNGLFKTLLSVTDAPDVEPGAISDNKSSIHGQNKDDGIILKIQLSNFQLLPHLLQLLKIYLDLSCGSGLGAGGVHSNLSSSSIEKDDDIVTFSNYLTQFFITFANSNQLIKSDPILNEWFITLNKINFENQAFLNNLLNELEKSVKSIAQRPHPQQQHQLQQLQQQAQQVQQIQQVQHPYSVSKGSLHDVQAPSVQSSSQANNQGATIKQESNDYKLHDKADDDDDDDDDDEGFLSLPTNASKINPPSVAAKAAFEAANNAKNQTRHMPPPPSVHQHLFTNNNPGSSLPRNSSSITSLLNFHNSDPSAPPVVVPTSIKEEELGGPNALSLSESTKNLYNLFNQITDDLTTTSANNSLTNLFQFNTMGSSTNLSTILNGAGSSGNLHAHMIGAGNTSNNQSSSANHDNNANGNRGGSDKANQFLL